MGIIIAIIVTAPLAGIVGYAACYIWPPEKLRDRIRRNWR